MRLIMPIVLIAAAIGLFALYTNGTYQRINGRPVYSYFVPLEESGGQINGLLQVTRRWGDFETAAY